MQSGSIEFCTPDEIVETQSLFVQMYIDTFKLVLSKCFSEEKYSNSLDKITNIINEQPDSKSIWKKINNQMVKS